MTDYRLDKFTVSIVWRDGTTAPEEFLADAKLVRITEGGVMAVKFRGNAWRFHGPGSWRDVFVAPRAD